MSSTSTSVSTTPARSRAEIGSAKTRNRTAVFEACWDIEPATIEQIAAEVAMCYATTRNHILDLEAAGEVYRIDRCGVGPDLWMVARTDAARRAAAARARERRAAAQNSATGAAA